MKISDKQFAQKLLSGTTNSNEIINYLKVCEKLFKKYGKAVFSGKYIETIKQSDNIIYGFLSVLKQSSKNNLSSIKNIIGFIKDLSQDYKPEFVVQSKSGKHKNKIIEHLGKAFENAKIQEQDLGNEDEVKIHGEGRYYKRSLEQDVKKLLNI